MATGMAYAITGRDGYRNDGRDDFIVVAQKDTPVRLRQRLRLRLRLRHCLLLWFSDRTVCFNYTFLKRT